MSGIILMSGRGNDIFSKLLLKQLRLLDVNDITVQEIERKDFAGSEKYHRIAVDDRLGLMGKKVIYVSSLVNDEAIEEQYYVGCALAKLGTARRIFVNPFVAYSTMERAVKPNEVVKFKGIARKFSAIPKGSENYFLMMDLHVAGSVHYFEGDCTAFELYAEPVLVLAIEQLIHDEKIDVKDVVFASADLGRPTWVKSYAKHFGTPIALFDKNRDFDQVYAGQVIGNVSGKIVIIYDDMVRSAKTLILAADSYFKAGAAEVYVVVSHCALTDSEALDRIESSNITKVICTNSHPEMYDWHQYYKTNPKLSPCNVSGIFASAIAKIIN